MNKVTTFLKQFGEWAQAVFKRSTGLSGGFLIGTVGPAVWNKLYPTTRIPWSISLSTSALCAVLATFLVWRDELTTKEKAEKALTGISGKPTVLLEFEQRGGLFWISEELPPTIRTDDGTVLNVKVHTIEHEDGRFEFAQLGSLGTTLVPLSPTARWKSQTGGVTAAMGLLTDYYYKKCQEEPLVTEFFLTIDYKFIGEDGERTTWAMALRRHGQKLQVLDHRHVSKQHLVAYRGHDA